MDWNEESMEIGTPKTKDIQSRNGQRHLDTWVWTKFHNFLCELKQVTQPV